MNEMNKPSIFKSNSILIGMIVFSILSIFVYLILHRMDIIFLPLYRLNSGIFTFLLLLFALLAAILFVKLSKHFAPQYTFIFLAISTIGLNMVVSLHLNGALFLLPLFFSIAIAGYPFIQKYKWVWLGVISIALIGAMVFLWNYHRLLLLANHILVSVIAAFYVFKPNKVTKLLGTLWTLSFPSYIVILLLVLSGGRYYIQDEDYLLMDITSPIDTQLKVMMTIEEAMIDQILVIHVYQPIGLGFYQSLGDTHLEYYGTFDFTEGDIQWDHIGDRQYTLTIRDNLTTITVTL